VVTHGRTNERFFATGDRSEHLLSLLPLLSATASVCERSGCIQISAPVRCCAGAVRLSLLPPYIPLPNSTHISPLCYTSFRHTKSHLLPISSRFTRPQLLLCINTLKPNGNYMYQPLQQSVVLHFVFMGSVRLSV
jgi:hypothetical protein